MNLKKSVSLYVHSAILEMHSIILHKINLKNTILKLNFLIIFLHTLMQTEKALLEIVTEVKIGVY